MTNNNLPPPSILPNSFSTPNLYVDEIMHLLSPEEYMVLSYACRRIFGFRKPQNQDRISLSQFATGTCSRTGTQLDNGTGLSILTIRRALAALKNFAVLVETDGYDKGGKIATEYALQDNPYLIDMDGLEYRHLSQIEARKRAAKDEKENGRVLPRNTQEPERVLPDNSLTMLPDNTLNDSECYAVTEQSVTPLQSRVLPDNSQRVLPRNSTKDSRKERGKKEERKEEGQTGATPPKKRPATNGASAAPPLSEEKEKTKEKAQTIKPISPVPKPEPKELMDNPAVIAFIEMFKLTPKLEQRRLIAENCPNLIAWNKTINAWQINGGNPQNLAGMLDKYAKEVVYLRNKAPPMSYRGSPGAQDYLKSQEIVQSAWDRMQREAAEKKAERDAHFAKLEAEEAAKAAAEKEKGQLNVNSS